MSRFLQDSPHKVCKGYQQTGFPLLQELRSLRSKASLLHLLLFYALQFPVTHYNISQLFTG